ncbi:MAG: amidohydrolase [Bacteroidetes bacterium]|nr:amidohydrolase [Bacteroidota bacterium]
MKINSPIYFLRISVSQLVQGLSTGWFFKPRNFYSNLLLLLSCSFILFSCSSKKIKVDLIVSHAKVYTVDGGFAVLESFAIRDGKIVAVGTNASIAQVYEADSSMDVQGKTILPGLIDAHCHFVGYGLGLQDCNLVGTKSFAEVIDRVKKYAATNKHEWIVARGWDQNDWAVKEYPNNKLLDSLFPGKPIILKRIDGHAALVSSEAMHRAKINDSTEVPGGEILHELIEGKSIHHKMIFIKGLATGILIDNAVDLVEKIIPQPDANTIRESLLAAQQNCFAVGLTTVDDAGLMKNQIDYIDQLQKKGELKMRIYAMLSDSLPNYEYYLIHGPYKTDFLNVRSFKFYADGALGSRGACLLKAYDDQTQWKGFLLNSEAHYIQKMKLLAQKQFQVCTHCIGDSANRLILSIYGNILSDTNISKQGIDRRWRIEHAQVVATSDIAWFGKFNIIPSVQPTHATSDMYWAEKRLGPFRVKTAYAYNDLLNAAGRLALGTDFPVEEINPMFTFYAAVTRQDQQHFPAGGFQMENALSKRNALMGMTSWAAYANFEENEKGSIEPGKFADFIILNEDPMTCSPEIIPTIKVLATYIAGQKVFERIEKK